MDMPTSDDVAHFCPIKLFVAPLGIKQIPAENCTKKASSKVVGQSNQLAHVQKDLLTLQTNYMQEENSMAYDHE